MIFFVLVLWMRTMASPSVGGHEPLVDREGADRRGAVAAVALVVHHGLGDLDLGERVVDVGVGMAGWADDAGLGQRGDAAAQAVELAAVGIGAPEGGEQDPVARRPGAGRSCSWKTRQRLVPPRM